MQEKGCSDFLGHVMDVHSIVWFGQKFAGRNGFCKL